MPAKPSPQTAGFRRLLAAHRGPWLFALSLLVVLVLLLSFPPRNPAIQGVAALALFPSEPDIRVLLYTLSPGQSLGGSGRPLFVRVAGSEPLRVSGGSLIADDEGLAIGTTRVPLPARLSPIDHPDIEIGARSYPGVIEVIPSEGRIRVINRVGLERYLEAVVTAEMGARFHEEALRAQAITARSYAVRRMLTRRSASYDVGDDQQSQVYRGSEGIAARAARAVASTRGIVIVHDGRVLDGLFSSTCGGTTRAAGEAFGGDTEAPLAGVRCGHCGRSPAFRWVAATPRSRLAAEWGPRARVDDVLGLRTLASGRLREAAFVVDGIEQALSCGRLRSLLGPDARSAWFTELAIDGEQVVARGLGFGHGVGLCQYGAEDLAARSGLDGPAIVAYYFPGSSLATAYPPTSP